MTYIGTFICSILDFKHSNRKKFTKGLTWRWPHPGRNMGLLGHHSSNHLACTAVPSV